MTDAQKKYEGTRLWLLANEGQASPEELAKLNNWLENDATVRRAIVELSQHQGWLTWHGLASPGMGLPALDRACADAAIATDVVAREGSAICVGVDEGSVVTTPSIASVSSWLASIRPCVSNLLGIASSIRVPLLSLKMAAIAAVVFLVGALWSSNRESDTLVVAAGPTQPSKVMAQVLTATPCLWNEHSGRMSAGGRFEEGDALKLLEGVAELQVSMRGGSADLQIEGPVAFVLGSEGITNLRYGKIIIENHSDHPAGFVVETSFGRVFASPGAEIGISAFGSIAEVHVFEGAADLDSPWMVSDSGDLISRTIESRTALRITQASDSDFQFDTVRADRLHFTPELSARGNFLAVREEYVNTVRGSEPVAYWRFQGTTDDVVRNEMGDNFHGKLCGNYRWVGTEDNRSIEFGVLPTPGMMRVNDSWDEALANDFTFEFWMKPSHYHHGTILSFAGEFNWEMKKNPLGIAIETVGGWGDRAATNRVRFLLRSPVGYRVNTSTYSDRIYAPRNWQHVIALRRGSTFETYLNAELVQSQPGKTVTPPGLELIVGKLYTDELYRPYIGGVDELAIYDRALSPSEIVEHHRAMQLDTRSRRDLAGKGEAEPKPIHF